MRSIDWSMYNFTAKELSCPCCGALEFDLAFLRSLQALRDRVHKPLPINSGYRCPKHEKEVGGSGANHPLGKAVDIGIALDLASLVIATAHDYDFTGIGIHQHGPIEGRYVHLDTAHTLHISGCPVIWTYA